MTFRRLDSLASSTGLTLTSLLLLLFGASIDIGLPLAFLPELTFRIIAGIGGGALSSGRESKDATLTTDSLCSNDGAEGTDIRRNGRYGDCGCSAGCICLDDRSDEGKLTLEGGGFKLVTELRLGTSG